MNQPTSQLTDGELIAEAQSVELRSKANSAQRARAVALLDELTYRLSRRMQTQFIGCSPDHCRYPDVVGLTPGVDVSIDGDVWPGSRFDKHLGTCPSMPLKTRARIKPFAPASGILHVATTGAKSVCGIDNPSHITDTARYADCPDCLAIVNGTRA